MMKFTKKEKVKARGLAYRYPEKLVITFECKCKYGSMKKENHHPDYSKPFEVQRLCKVCHNRIHSRERFGDKTTDLIIKSYAIGNIIGIGGNYLYEVLKGKRKAGRILAKRFSMVGIDKPYEWWRSAKLSQVQRVLDAIK